jgi:hypothetical protein
LIKFLMMFLLSFSLQAFGQGFEPPEISEVCITAPQDVEECFESHELALSYLDDQESWASITEARKGKTKSDDPSSAQLLSAAIEAVAGIEFQGSMSVTIETPSGYKFIVKLTGGKKRRALKRKRPMRVD